MHSGEQFIKKKLLQRVEAGNLRRLSSEHPPIDFCSNDYLGFARNERLRTGTAQILEQNRLFGNGSGGSRLLAGNLAFTEETEAVVAAFHGAEAGLIFNSGYDANLGLLSSLPQRGDTIITDELVHASIIDGARLSFAGRFSFRHNDLEDLQRKLQQAKGNIYIVVESVYSMDGDLAPLTAISSLCLKFGANLIVDEAHAFGIFGHYGRGLVQQYRLEDQVFARILTFGKALGTHGAIVLGSHQLREYLINFARSFIYTTAAPAHNIAAIRCGYTLLEEKDYTLEIQKKIAAYKAALDSLEKETFASNTSAIQTLHLPGNTQTRTAAQSLQRKGFDVRAILSPTVPAGTERLRICLHTFNTEIEIQQLIHSISEIYKHE